MQPIDPNGKVLSDQPPGQDALEQIILEPVERRDAFLETIRSARTSVSLSVFRCHDFKIMDELADALGRGVRVRLLLTAHAKGWDERLKELAAYLSSMGAEVRHYAGALRKYHAKYMAVDGNVASVSSMNFTRKCFDNTCDFLLITRSPGIVTGLHTLFDADWEASENADPSLWSERLIVSPENARQRITRLLNSASKSIQIIDHKLDDERIAELLAAKRAKGVEVEILGRGDVGDMVSHGKMFLIDRQLAVLGSISLSRKSLDSRREVSVIVRDAACVRKLADFFETVRAETGAAPVESEEIPDVAS